MRSPTVLLLPLVAALLTGCGGLAVPEVADGGPATTIDSTTPGPGQPSPPPAGTDAIEDCEAVPELPAEDRPSTARLEAARDEIMSNVTGGDGPDEPYLFGVGIGNALGRASVDGVGDRDILAARLASVVSDPNLVCLTTAPFPTGDDAEPAEWTLTRAPAPEDAVLALTVVERACSGGDDADGRTVVGVSETATTVTLEVRVVPKPGANTCPGNPSTLVDVTLDAPVGDRAIVDAATGEPATVTPDGPADGD